jgi:hypothetical protein
VGRLSATKSFVHVLDDTSLDLVLTNRDTVSDFVAYLRKKEAFVLSGRLGMAAGEEALLGRYVGKVNDEDEHDFIDSLEPSDRPLVLNENRWHDFLRSGEHRRQVEADEVSYLWDFLIEQFADHYMAGTSHHLTEATSTHYHFESVLRSYARENRTRRRLLARSLVEMQRTTPSNQRRLRIIPPLSAGDPYWVLLLFPFPDKIGRSVSYERYREVRQEYLNSCIRVVKFKFPDALDIVGFATESGRREHGSEDAAYLDAREWTAAQNEDARLVQQRLQILVSPNRIKAHVAEYPKARS